MRVPRLRLIALLVLSSVSPLAQGQSDLPQFRAGVELVQLDVAVLDDKRQPVRGLTAADFTVLDNGVATPIRAFTPVELAPRTRATEAVWAEEVPPDVVTNQVGQQDGRLVIILMDRSIPVQQPTIVARKIAAAAVEALGPHDLAAVDLDEQRRRTESDGRSRAPVARHQPRGSEHGHLARTGGGHGQAGPAQRRALPVRVVRARDDHARGRRRAEHAAAAQSPLLHRQQRDLAIEPPGGGGRRGRRVRDPGSKTRARLMFAAVDRANLTVHSIDPQGLVNIGPQTRAGARGGFDRPVNSGPTERLRQQQTDTTDLLTGQQSLQVLPGPHGREDRRQQEQP